MPLPTRETAVTWGGRRFVDSSGQTIGTCSAVYGDEATGKPEWVLVSLADGGGRVLPLVDAVEESDAVRVQVSLDKVRSAPTPDADAGLDADQEITLYEHYGIAYSRDDSPTILPVEGAASSSTSSSPAAPPRRSRKVSLSSVSGTSTTSTTPTTSATSPTTSTGGTTLPAAASPAPDLTPAADPTPSAPVSAAPVVATGVAEAASQPETATSGLSDGPAPASVLDATPASRMDDDGAPPSVLGQGAPANDLADVSPLPVPAAGRDVSPTSAPPTPSPSPSPASSGLAAKLGALRSRAGAVGGAAVVGLLLVVRRRRRR